MIKNAHRQSSLAKLWRQGSALSLRALVMLLSGLLVMGVSLETSRAQDGSRRVAVLEFKNSAGLSSFEITSLTSIVRGSASRLSGYTVMTKENITTLLPPDKKIEDCVGSCEVETGKLIGASFIITGEVGRVESQLQLSIRLFNTEQGSLLGQEVVVGANLLELQQQLGKSSQTLLAKLSVASVESAVSSSSSVLLSVSPPNATLELNGGPLYLDDHPKQGDSDARLVRLKPGKYTLRGELNGYLSQEERFVLTEGSLIEVNLTLNKALKKDTSCEASDPACRGTIVIMTSPAGARLWVDGQSTDYVSVPSRRDPTKGAVSIDLPPGEHVIEARLAQHLPAKGRLTLKKDDINQQLQKSPLVLTPNFGHLSLESTPAGATIFLDNKQVGQTPWSVDKIDAGPHKVRLFKEDYRTAEAVVVVRRGQATKQRLTLEPTFATMSVELRSEGQPVSEAAIMIDQKLIGRTDERGQLNLGRQSEGARQLQVLHPLYAPVVKTLEVQAGSSRTERLLLQPAYATLIVKAKGGLEASVEVDGEPIGRISAGSTFTQRVPSGNVILGVIPQDRARYNVFKKKLALGVKERVEVEADCSPRLGELMVISNPPEADVYVDGEKKGLSPLKVKLFQGEHEIMLSLPSYAKTRQRVEVEEGELNKVNIELLQDPQVQVSCVPGGEVYAEGVKVGPTPQLITRKPGRYEVACNYQGLWERANVTLSDRREELTLRIMPARLKAQEAERSSKRIKMWVAIGASALFGGMALSKSVNLSSEVEARDADISRLDAQAAWAHDQEAQSLSSSAKLWLGLSASAALWGLYEWVTMPAEIKLSTEVKAQAWQPVLSPYGVGVMGRF